MSKDRPDGLSRLVVTVKNATDLSDVTLIGTADPYVVLRLADAEIQTKHNKNSGEQGEWNESFAFNNVSEDDELHVRNAACGGRNVYDYNIIKRDAFMGRGTMSLKEVMMGKVTDACVQLHDIKGKGELGQVYLSFALDGTLSPGMSLDFGRGSMAMRRGAFAVWRGRIDEGDESCALLLPMTDSHSVAFPFPLASFAEV
ncbi:hypothetical protein H632_c2428p0 [Helicosporidium sp. ATCC 50920]|nr:hypothetical protein H632_c2428p0 [Helicosporidium sp. ATCC 50920]|eukprot:KDD73206.1 hypothetical protein H632_c2428p0 [Helicosporidium sp. ATCC 50920]